MLDAARRFFTNLVHGGTPVNGPGLSARARTDAGLDASDGGVTREEDVRQVAEMLSRTGGDGATQDLALRVRGKRPDRRG